MSEFDENVGEGARREDYTPCPAGTFIRFGDFGGGEGMGTMLYLRPDWSFLIVQQFGGFEWGSAVGTWSRDYGVVHLTGVGSSRSCTGGTRGDLRVTMTFAWDGTAPYLELEKVEGEDPLFLYEGRYNYAGPWTVIAPPGFDVPATLEAVDALIEKLRQSFRDDSRSDP